MCFIIVFFSILNTYYNMQNRKYYPRNNFTLKLVHLYNFRPNRKFAKTEKNRTVTSLITFFMVIEVKRDIVLFSSYDSKLYYIKKYVN